EFEKLKMKVVNTYDYWGECCLEKYNKCISFNTCLAFLPIEYTEYVIVHELCHLRQMNHSKLFWEEVLKIMPDAKKRRKMLRAYSAAWYLERLGVKGKED
ncbi:MAG: M48 family metallopeptidase, partial [Anaeroplasmataceae bacterium]|nr:M48 family metallopeptidase [Anaeroplasmataceae bacterium]